MTRIRLLSTGGTIGTQVENPLDLKDYPVTGRRISASQMAESMLPSGRSYNLDCQSMPPLSSTALGPAEWWDILGHIRQAQCDPSISGLVISHGSGTVEETAFLIDLLTDTADMGIVFTASQRPVGALSSDAALNLHHACLTAASASARDLGVLVVAGSEIHSARDVVKSDNFALNTFRSCGPLGTLTGDQVSILRRPATPSPTLLWDESQDWPRVDIVAAYPGADRVLIDAALDAGAAGLVIIGIAPGYATPDQRAALRDAEDQGVIVVMASRAASGVTESLRQNAVPGLIGSGMLPPSKARILLAVALMQGGTRDDIAALFAQDFV